MALPLSDDDGDGVWNRMIGLMQEQLETIPYLIVLLMVVTGSVAKENIVGLPCADNVVTGTIEFYQLSIQTLSDYIVLQLVIMMVHVHLSQAIDESAMNYNPAASEDDGSCEFLVEGATVMVQTI